MQARAKVEADALAALEGKFAAEDKELFRLLAERTLPEVPPVPGADESAADARHGFALLLPFSLGLHAGR